MLRLVLHIALLMLFSLTGKAVDLRIEVKDKNSMDILEGVTVKVSRQGVSKPLFEGPSSSVTVIHDVLYPILITCSHTGYEAQSLFVRKSMVSSKDGSDYLLIIMERSVTQMNEFVVTGQSTPVLAKQSIYKVNTLSATGIAQRGGVSLNDVLSYEMNNFVSNDNILGTSVNIGGVGGQNVKVLINGIPVMGRENGNIDMGQLNLSNVKRIEMIQGPMSVVYGSNALGGVINLITNTPRKRFSIGARTYLESIGRYNFMTNCGFNKGRHQLQVSLARNFFSGWSPGDSLDRYQLWKPKTQYVSDLQYSHQWRKLKWSYFTSYLYEKISNKGQPIINPYEGYAFDEYYRTQRLLNALTANVDVNAKNHFSFSNSYQVYHRTKNRYRKDLVSLTQFETSNVGDQDTTNFYDINLRGSFNSSAIRHSDVVLGYEYTHESGSSYKLASQQQSIYDLGLYGSFLYKMKVLQIQPSARVSFNQRYGTNFTPAFHVKMDLNAHTQGRLSYARGFRAPTLKEMYLQFIDQNHTIIGNPELKPETGDHLQFGIDHQQTIRKANLSYSINGFYNHIDNLISLAVYNNHGILRQYANIRNYRNWILNVRGMLSVANLSVQCGTGMIYVYASNITPEHVIGELTCSASYLLKKWNTTLNANYKFNSRQPVITVDQDFLYTSPLHVANLSIQKSLLKKRLVSQVGVKNLFNVQNATLTGNTASQTGGHSASGSIQIFPERSLFLDLNYSF